MVVASSLLFSHSYLVSILVISLYYPAYINVWLIHAILGNLASYSEYMVSLSLSLTHDVAAAAFSSRSLNEPQQHYIIRHITVK